MLQTKREISRAYIHHNLFDILHVFTRKIKTNIANKTYKHTAAKKLIKNCYTRVTFLLTMVPPVHVAFLGEAYEFCRQLPL